MLKTLKVELAHLGLAFQEFFAKSFTTALFNNVKVGEEGETMAIPVEVVKILMKNRHFYDCIPGQRGDDPSETECSFVCIALRTAFQANTHRGEAR